MRLKWISGLFICLGLVLLMSHNTSAWGPIPGFDTTASSWNASGVYGYYINGNYGRNQSWSGFPPVELITGSKTTVKRLYGVQTAHNMSITDQKKYHHIRVGLVLSSSSPQDDAIAGSIPVVVQLTYSNSTYENITTGCGANYTESTPAYLEAVCDFTLDDYKVPTRWSLTIGRTGQFTYGTDEPIITSGMVCAVSSVSCATISVHQTYEQWTGSNDDTAAIIGGLDEINDTLNDQFDQENEAIDNISNQQPPASGSGQNSTTSSLLDTLGSFLTAITNLSATNCEVVLAFPSFAGGSQTVNICQNKEYTGNVVSVAGSIILVLFYLPVAFMLINKIYSEIRSFTNG